MILDCARGAKPAAIPMGRGPAARRGRFGEDENARIGHCGGRTLAQEPFRCALRDRQARFRPNMERGWEEGSEASRVGRHVLRAAGAFAGIGHARGDDAGSVRACPPAEPRLDGRFSRCAMECRKTSNRKGCACSYDPCARKGICCECIAAHVRVRELPGCCFSKEAERTYDRSFEHFAKLVAGRKI